MSMKKEIRALLKGEDGTCKINNICYLSRWTKDYLDRDVDCMRLEFKQINGINYSRSVDIESRDVDEVLDIIKVQIAKFMAYATERMISDIDAGRR